MFGVEKSYSTEKNALDGSKLYIGIVYARFNQTVTQAMMEVCKTTLLGLGVEEAHLDVYSVPGALELPIALQALASKEEYDALIAIGCVIRGETYHFELVANESATGIARVATDHKVPIINAVLTVETTAQAQARTEPKAVEAAQAAVEMGNLINRLA